MSKRQMVMNYVPGEECRVAIVEDGKLDDFHAERMDGPSSHVGSIYVGKVVNVEPAIQAAFIDFGLEANGFLHVSDVHPQYFPGEDSDKTERVGKKTPRRERPPIQDCFRRGDEVAVQVLKEGVGTKGPTVTSYLSIPGRFLVMMPQMDKVGVSRKVEDEDTRRKMREILDQLDLPEGFGFILRTAGMERTKAELKRDLAYLMRLWKDMEKRWRSGNKPRLLYSESDLLVRALRDLLTSDIDQIVVDNQAALNRAARFLKIVAPRTSTKLLHFTGKTPIFHALGVEPQIQIIHAREVPLASGGRLVIDETEALVAIDVNSGKSRDARDSETNAYQTNEEAVDEICRQIKLRDLGGVIVSDLIDMRSAKHRRDIENRMKENLKKDRARWTTAPISEFGILEMTRQRMRASHESQHFTDCPTCRGRGLVQRPDSVTSDALRELAAIIDSDKVFRVEMVVSPRLAGELLSTSRKALSRLERSSGKHVDVRVSEAIQLDRVTFYAYDERGADLDVTRIATRQLRDEEMIAYEITADAAEAENWAEPETVIEAPEPEEVVDDLDMDPHPIELEPVSLNELSDRPQQPHGREGDEQGGQGEPGGRRRRGRRRGRGGRGRGGQGPSQFDSGMEQSYPGAGQPAHAINPEDQEPLAADPSHAIGEGSHHHEQHADNAQFNGAMPHGHGDQPGGPGGSGEGDGTRRKRRRRRRGRGGRGPDGAGLPGGQQNFGGQPHDHAHPMNDGAPAEHHDDNPGDFAAESEGHASPEGMPHGDQAEQQAQGQPHFDGQQPEGDGQGGPRRRRRRRGRGGRGGGQGGQGGAGGPGGQNAPGGQPQQQQQRPPQHQANHGHGQPHQTGGPARGTSASAPPSLAAMFRSNSPAPTPVVNAPVDHAHGDDAEVDDGGHDEGPHPEGAPPAGEGGPRKRRRRGRGRGRGGSGGEGGGQGTQPGANEPTAPQGRQQARPQDLPVNQPRPSAPPQPQRGAPQPPAPKAGGPEKPKVRTLYAGSRRRLAPGDIKNIKRED